MEDDEKVELMAMALCEAFNSPAIVAWQETKAAPAEIYRRHARACFSELEQYRASLSAK